MLITAHVLKEKWLKITGFAHSQTTNKLVNEAANDSARVSGQDRKKPPALGTNQIAGFGGFRQLASLEKNKNCYFRNRLRHFKSSKHTYGYKAVCFYDEKYTKPVQIFKGENAVFKFLEITNSEEIFQ